MTVKTKKRKKKKTRTDGTETATKKNWKVETEDGVKEGKTHPVHKEEDWRFRSAL